MAAAGLTEDDIEPVEVWEEHHQVFNLFVSLGTQWRTGMSGPTGLDYMVLYHKMDRMGLDPTEYAQLEADIQVMEREALSTMHTKE